MSTTQKPMSKTAATSLAAGAREAAAKTERQVAARHEQHNQAAAASYREHEGAPVAKNIARSK